LALEDAMNYWWIVPAAIVGIVLVWLAWRRLHAFGKQVAIERARELFKLQRERLEAQFFQIAAATGKPRGLRWKDCEWDDPVEFARDRESGQVHALVGVTIAFEAIAGSDMEGLPAVGNLRNASAVFVFTAGRWVTHGKAVFNMNPDEAIKHFESQYERIA
jgi:hypothetical protein